MTSKTVPGLTFVVYFENECGMEAATIHASSVADMVRRLRATFPDDIGADGFFIDPFTGEERALEWGALNAPHPYGGW